METSVSLSYTAKDASEFMDLVNSLKSLGLSVNTNVSQPKSIAVIAKQMGPLESYYIKTTGKSMRASPGLDREEVARERLIAIGVNLATIIAVKNATQDSTQDGSSQDSGNVFGALDDIDEDDTESGGNPVSTGFDEDVHYVAEDPSGEPF